MYGYVLLSFGRFQYGAEMVYYIYKKRKAESEVRRKLTIAMLLMVVVLMGGCGQAKASPQDKAEYYEKLLAGEEGYREETLDTVKRVGVAMPTMTSERWINDGMNMKAKLERLGYEVDLQYADDDIELQIAQIEKMIQSEVDCLVISAIDSAQLTDSLQKAKEKHIPVISYDRLLMDTDAVSYYASFDNKAVGTLIGGYIVDGMGLDEAAADGRSYTIEFFMGSPDDNNALFLYDGLMEQLQPYLDNGTLVCRSGQTSFEETCILRWSRETARQRCQMLLETYYQTEKLDIACSAFDGFVYGILQACDREKLAQEKMPFITGQDADREAIANIAQGRQAMSIFKDTRVLSSKCVKMVQAVLENTQPEINDVETYDNNVMTVESYLCDPVVVDAENYEELLIQSGYYTYEQIFE